MILHLNWTFLCTVCILIHGLLALYEDQAGLFDWRRQYVGKANFVEYVQSSQSGARIIVGTDQNVIAAINGKNGHIGWRHMLEKGVNGQIDDMKVYSNYVIAVLAGGSYIRCFNSISGSLLWEAAVPSALKTHTAVAQMFGSDMVSVLTNDHLTTFNVDTGNDVWNVTLPDISGEYVHLARADDVLFVIGQVSGSHISVTSVNRNNGVLLSTRQVLAPWITAEHKCSVVNGAFLVCADISSLAIRTLSLIGSTSSFVMVSLPGEISYDYNELMFYPMQSSPDQSAVGVVFALRVSAHDSLLIVLDTGASVKSMKILSGVVAVQFVNSGGTWTAVTLSRGPATGLISIKALNLEVKDAVSDISHTIALPTHHGTPNQMYIGFTRSRDISSGFTALIVSDDYSLVLLEQPKSPSPGKVLWSREEALSSVVSVELVDLPVSQIMAKMEDEFGTHGDSLWNLFVKRFTTQFSQFVTFLLQLKQKLRAPRHSSPDRGDDFYDSLDNQDVELMSQEFDEDYLTRDEFNLHKIIVVVTAPGKIYGLDSLTGNVVWQNLLPSVKPFQRLTNSDGGQEMLMPLFVQRTTAHFPHQPLCTVLCRDASSGHAVLYTFHPINGNGVDGLAPVRETFKFKVVSAVMLAQMDDQFLKPLLLLDNDKQYHVYPASATELVKSHASSLFTFVTDVESGIISGYRLSSSSTKQLLAEPLWTVDTNKNVQTITNVVSKRAMEHVHSQGIVLEDRSVLYKYLNPNLISVVAEGEDSQQKAFITVYLLDAVTGNLVFHCMHKRAKGPVHLVLSENWLVYNYWSQKHRRVELAVLELYEGNRQSNSTAFSSFHPPPPPIVMRQAYIFPGHLSAMATTVTEKGITSKELLFALETGGVLGLPKMIIDPRRPEVMSPEAREEGLIPYAPELPRPYDRIINYNQSVFNIRGIHTAPAGLESTSLVLCYGLDLFFTRVMPSKMFDVLKEDFDYFFISSVLVGMIVVSVVSQKLAARKALSRAWK